MRLKLLFFEPRYVATIWVVTGKGKDGGTGGVCVERKVSVL